MWPACCAGLLHKKSQEGTQTTMEATLATQQTPQQREQVLLALEHPHFTRIFLSHPACADLL
jgi:hypothetical protein